MARTWLIVRGNTSDTAAGSHLTGLGDTVTYRDDGDAANAATDASTYDGVIITSTVTSGTITTKYQQHAIPVVTMQVAIWDAEMRLFGANGGAQNDTAITVTNTTHPIMSGLSSGALTVYSASAALSGSPTANMASGGTSLAAHPAFGTYTVLAAYESGANLTTGTAPARRVAFGIPIVESMNTAGLDLFDAALDWAVPTAVPPAEGSASGSWSFTGSATGAAPEVPMAEGTASGSWSFTGAAAGEAPAVPPAEGSATGAWSFTGSAVGESDRFGVVSGVWSFAGSAAGESSRAGTASGSWSFTGAAEGTSTPPQNLTAPTLPAGPPVVDEAFTATPGTWSEDAETFEYQWEYMAVASGTATGSWSFTGFAAGEHDAEGSASGSWAFAGAATGESERAGVASGAWAFTGAASGEHDAEGSTSGEWSFTGSAVGSAPTVGMAEGSALGSWGFTGTATGSTTRSGEASGSWSFSGSATGSVPAPIPEAGNGLRRILYVARHDTTRGHAAVRGNWDNIDEICPSWWAPNDDGTISLQGGATEDTSLVADAIANDVAVRPALVNDYGGTTNWDWTPVSTVLNNPTLRTTLVGNIVDLVLDKGYSGIDIDFEHPPDGADRAEFTAFVEELADALHAVDRAVAVTFPARVSIASSLVWDYQALGQIADQCRAMLYDDIDGSGPRSPSSITWWERAVAFLAGQIPADRLVLGAPTYGYIWNDGVIDTSTALWEDIEDAVTANGGSKTYETSTETQRADWSEGGVTKVAYYENAQSLAAKAELVRDYNLAGMHFWRAGGEDPAVYSSVSSVLADPEPSGSIDIQPTADTTIDAADTDNDRSTQTTVLVKASLERRILMRFDVSSVPDGATVDSATLNLYKSGFFSTDPVGRTYAASRLTQTAWVVDGDNGNPSAHGVTWQHYDVAAGLTWASPGGDYTTTGQATATVPSTGNWMTWDVATLVDWARSNGGTLDLVIRDTVTASNHQAQFVSLEGSEAQRPKLTIGYSVAAAPPSGTASGSWSFTGFAAGEHDAEGTASGAWTFAGSATGSAPEVGVADGTASGVWGFTGTATGARASQGSASGEWVITGTAEGAAAYRGAAAGTWGFAGAAAGTAPTVGERSGNATGAWSFTGTAAGYRTSAGTAAGQWVYVGAAAGSTDYSGAAVGQWVWVGTAAGRAIEPVTPRSRTHLVDAESRTVAVRAESRTVTPA